MIVRSEMMPALLEACPSFAPQYSKFCAEWQNNPSKPDYLALAELARHIAERFDRNEMQEIPTLFTAVERLLLEGEPYVSEALTVGLLENLQNSNIYPTENWNALTLFFSPETAYWWGKVYDFWNKSIVIADDRKPI
jgi:hypothetical protein